MIGFLRGTLVDRTAKGEVLVDVNGVGYRVTVPTGALGRLGPLDGPVALHVHTHVREDALVLYGFPTREERGCFEVLLGAHGVGPSLALAILGAHTPLSLRSAVASDDVDALTVVPGVGKKTAARLLIELKSRLEVDDADGYAGAIAAAGDGVAVEPVDARTDVRAALGELGFGVDEIRAVLRRLPVEGTAQELLRLALRELGGSPTGARR